MKKLYNMMMSILFLMLFASIVISVNADEHIISASEEAVVLADGVVPVLETDTFSFFGGDVLVGIATVLIAVILITTLYVLLEAIKQLGLSVPPDIVQSWTDSFKDMADSSMDKLREQSKLTASPFDDMALAGLEYSLPKVLAYLETMIVSDEELQSLVEAAKKPVSGLDASLLVQLE